MPRVCPRPCGRLTTAAVFIAVGVVQILVGIILLRSEIDLLSGPDFMIGSSNIGIGCLYGMAASVWNSKKKQRSSRQSARNSVLASFLFSIVALNATSAVILILGDGNKLLFVYMEAIDRKSTATFANEVLAGAYVTSVCSPIVCLVVAIVALSGSCFQAYGNKHKNLDQALDVESPFGLVSNSKTHTRPKLVSDCLAETPTTSSDQSPRFSEDSVFSEKDTRPSRRQSNTYIPSPVNTWAHKRKHILRNSKSLKKRSQIFDACIPELNQFSNQELIPRIRESSILKENQSLVGKSTPPCCDSIKLAKEKRSNQSTSVGIDLKKKTDSKCSHGVRNSQMTDRSSEVRFAHSPGCSYRSESFESNEAKSDVVCSRNSSFEYFATKKSTPSDASYPRKDLAHVDDLALRHAEIHLLEKINPTLVKLKEKTMQELKTRVRNIPPVVTSSEVITQKESAGGLKQSEQSASNSAENLVAIQEASDLESEFPENLEKLFLEEAGISSIEDVHRGKNDSMKISSETFPLSGPSTSPYDTIKRKKTKLVHNSILNSIKSKTVDFPQIECQLSDKSECREESITQSPICNDGKKKITNLVLDCPKVPSIKLQSRKRDVTKRMSSMASITEIPSEESVGDTNIDQNSVDQHQSSASNDPEMLVKDENANIALEQTAVHNGISPETVKRKKPSANLSFKNLLKGIWTSSGPEAKLNILELIMDEDSLIGLSEEELITRTLRIRALRKAVAERLKNEIERDPQMERAVEPAFTASTD